MKRNAFLLPIILNLCLFFVINISYASPEPGKGFHSSVSFIENKGQLIDQHNVSRKDIQFALQQKGMSIFVGNGEFHYQWMQTLLPADGKIKVSANEKITAKYARIDVKLLGANRNAQVIKEQKAEDYRNYYLPQCPDGITAEAYQKITYKDIYPNIDWVLYINSSNTLKYDFIVHKGADPSVIQLQYNGTSAINLTPQGSLKIRSSLGSVEEDAPLCYLEGGKKISSEYQLNGTVLSFKIDQYDALNNDLIIDPSLDWSTYFGGNNDDFGYSVATDTNGNAYLAGRTNSTTSIATSGAYAGTLNSSSIDAFIAMYNTSGSLQWATYYGGSNTDIFFYLATDTLDHVYAAGLTASTSAIASSSGVSQSSYGGGNCDAYLVKFNKNGTRSWATYFGGTGDESTTSTFDDYMVGVAWDHFTNTVYLVGNTVSTGLGTVSGHTSISGGADAYITQFSPSGTVQWCSYYGGTAEDRAVKVACDGNGFAYIIGTTRSSSGIAYPSSSSVAQGTYSGSMDAFIAKFNSTGGVRWCTYLGGTDPDYPQGVGTDVSGDVYIAGTTTSTGLAYGNNVYQNSIIGGSESFLTKYDSSGARSWFTYFGGLQADLTSDIAIDATGNVCFSGTTASGGLGTANAWHPSLTGSNTDAFLAVFSPSGSRTYVTYFGDSGVENAFGISYSRLGDLFMAGCTNSTTGITHYANQPVIGGNQDAYICKFKADTSAFIVVPFSPLSYCQGDSIHVPYGVTNPFLSGNSFTLQLSDASGSFATPVTLGTLSSATAGVISGRIPVGQSIGTGYRIRIVGSSPANTSFDNGSNISVKLKPAAPTFTTNSPVCSGNTLTFSASTTTSGSGITYSWKGPNGFTNNSQSTFVAKAPVSATGYYAATVTLNGCAAKDSVLLTVKRTPDTPVITGSRLVCTGDSIRLSAASGPSGVSYNWRGPSSFTATTQDIKIGNLTTSSSGYYVATATLGTCSSTDSVNVVVKQSLTPTLTVSPNPITICINDTAVFTAVGTSGGKNPTYQWYSNGNLINNTLPLFVDTFGQNGDIVRCIFTSDELCLTRPADTVDITLVKVPPVPPQVSVTADPVKGGPPWCITFRAHPTFGGPHPTYKWYKNGILIPLPGLGVDRDTVILCYDDPHFAIEPGDIISCSIISDLSCTNPKEAFSNTIAIDSLTGIGKFNMADQLQLFPNPNTGEFVIKGELPMTGVYHVEVINSIGQIVFNKELTASNKQISTKITLPDVSPGVYLLRLRSGDDIAVWRVVVNSQ